MKRCLVWQAEQSSSLRDQAAGGLLFMCDCILVCHAQQAKALVGEVLVAGCKQASMDGEFSGEELPPGVAALQCSTALGLLGNVFGSC